LVDDAVSRAYGYDENGCGPGTGPFRLKILAGGMLCSSTIVRDRWNGSTRDIRRLMNEDVTISSTAAYLDLLPDHQPPGTSWAAVYGTPQQGIGVYNSTPKFVDGFAKAPRYFSYLDTS
jgi:hypothetical protein